MGTLHFCSALMRYLISLCFFSHFALASPLAAKNSPCGPGVDSCSKGLCCSQWGWCGTSYYHCDNSQGCQASFGICTGAATGSSVSVKTTAKSTATSISSPPSTPISSAPSSSAPSITSSATSPLSTSSSYAYLGQPCGVVKGLVVRAYPGNGDPLLSGLCCSSLGVAGVTSDHCGTGCQTKYGRCATTALPALSVGCVKPKDFAVTFDDGPSVVTASLLDYLKTVSVKVTFFINGINSQAPTDIPRYNLYDAAMVSTLQRAVAEGHQICHHTWSHQSVIDANDYNLTYEVTRLNQAFKVILGKVPTCIRPPYGNLGDESARILQSLGYGGDSNGGAAAIIDWNLDPVDWSPTIHGKTIPAQIADEATEFRLQTTPQANLGLPNTAYSKFTGKLLGSPSTIALNHDSWATTADFRPNGLILPLKTTPLAQQAIEYLRAQGFNLVRIDQCLGHAVDGMYRVPNGNDDYCGDAGSTGAGNCKT